MAQWLRALIYKGTFTQLSHQSPFSSFKKKNCFLLLFVGRYFYVCIWMCIWSQRMTSGAFFSCSPFQFPRQDLGNLPNGLHVQLASSPSSPLSKCWCYEMGPPCTPGRSILKGCVNVYGYSVSMHVFLPPRTRGQKRAFGPLELQVS